MEYHCEKCKSEVPKKVHDYSKKILEEFYAEIVKKILLQNQIIRKI